MNRTEESGEKEREVGVSRFAFTVLAICKEKKPCGFFKIEEKE